ncbi:aspartyl-phosphate phosphatase Spo0E family protein [Bacillus albus]|uniref:aspartyl-phosphate phosphatase Spo0E family protein n=1 Tax=Bacillus albus TaxID=2026189 RepID=UPI001419683F|nr:aspartyl-phosphate phosphatase Spo0E family protein [Bacillus albus]
MNLTKLNDRIEAKKQELIHLVEQYGFTHDKVISFSQELDRLLNLLIELKTKKKTLLFITVIFSFLIR